MKKKISLFIIFGFIFFTPFLSSSAALQNKILAKVGSQLISTFELKNKIKIILFLTNQEVNQKNIDNTKREALDSLINLKLKKEEISRYNVQGSFNERADQYFENLSKKYNTNFIGLKEIFKVNNIDFEMFYDEIKTELAWQKIIFDLYKDKISINDNEIDKELRLAMKNDNGIKSYNLSEIEIVLNNQSNIDNEISEIQAQINQIGFENTAIKFSSAPTALEGGGLGWINSKSLSKKILNEISNMEKGDISKPIVQGNSILFIKLVDSKITENNDIDIESLKNKIVSAKKNDVLNLYSNNHLSKIRNNSLIEIK